MDNNINFNDQKNDEQTVPKTVRLKPSVIRILEEFADVDNRTFSNAAETMILRGVQQFKKNQQIIQGAI